MCFGSLETDLCHSNTTASSENTDITEKMLLKKKKDRKSNNKKQIIVWSRWLLSGYTSIQSAHLGLTFQTQLFFFVI